MQTAITHSNRNDKSFIELTWIAPSAGTGPLVFRCVFTRVLPITIIMQIAGDTLHCYVSRIL